jgi:threonine dehydratase
MAPRGRISAMDFHQAVLIAESRIRRQIRETPVEYSPYLSAISGSHVYLKLEHLQHTGSFKLRGATNKILSLSANDLHRGVIAASNGNHGIAVAFAARQVGAAATIYMRETVSPAKVTLIESLGAKVIRFGDVPLDAELRARHDAAQSGCVFISPYNDPEVIAGQGTIGVELSRQLAKLDAVFVATGGGGLASGIAGYLKTARPEVKIVGCCPVNSRVLYESIKAGQVVDFPEDPTISDSTAGGVEEGAITVDLCRRLVDDFVLVSEAEIVTAMKLVLAQERWLIEGAAGVAVAGYLRHQAQFPGKTVAILLCGRNLAPEKLPLLLSP